MKPKTLVIRIRRRLVVYFAKSLRPVFDRIASTSGLRQPGDPPCDAELARVLVVAQLLREEPPAVAVAAALHANAVVSLSRRLAALAQDLVPDLKMAVQGLAGAARPVLPRQAPRGPGGGDRSRPRVCLVLDEWTHARLVAHAAQNPTFYDGQPVHNEDGWTRPCAPDMALVRGLLEGALRNADRSLAVVVGYTSRIHGIETALERAIGAERETIAKALREAAAQT